jgi:hypothetical protein
VDINILGVSIVDISIIECRWKHATAFNAIYVLFHGEVVQWAAISGKLETAILISASCKDGLPTCTVVRHVGNRLSNFEMQRLSN